MLGKLYELEHYLQESNICLAEKADFPPKSIASLLHKIEFKLESPSALLEITFPGLPCREARNCFYQ